MSTKTKKYIFVNGVMKANPEYKKGGIGEASPTTTPTGSSPAKQGNHEDAPLAVVCSMEDIESATKLQAVTTGAPMQMSEQTSESLMNIQEEDFLDGFHAPEGVEIDGGEIIDKLSDYFIQYEVFTILIFIFIN